MRCSGDLGKYQALCEAAANGRCRLGLESILDTRDLGLTKCASYRALCRLVWELYGHITTWAYQALQIYSKTFEGPESWEEHGH